MTQALEEDSAALPPADGAPVTTESPPNIDSTMLTVLTAAEGTHTQLPSLKHVPVMCVCVCVCVCVRFASQRSLRRLRHC
jgi:hypothetical protein